MTFANDIYQGYKQAERLGLKKDDGWLFAEMLGSQEQEHLDQCWRMAKYKLKVIGIKFIEFSRLYQEKKLQRYGVAITKTSKERVLEILDKMGIDNALTTAQGLDTLKLALIEQLDRGAVKIENIKLKGGEVDRLEDRWIEVLHAYEFVCDLIASDFRLQLIANTTN